MPPTPETTTIEVAPGCRITVPALPPSLADDLSLYVYLPASEVPSSHQPPYGSSRNNNLFVLISDAKLICEHPEWSAYQTEEEALAALHRTTPLPPGLTSFSEPTREYLGNGQYRKTVRQYPTPLLAPHSTVQQARECCDLFGKVSLAPGAYVPDGFQVPGAPYYILKSKDEYGRVVIAKDPNWFKRRKTIESNARKRKLVYIHPLSFIPSAPFTSFRQHLISLLPTWSEPPSLPKDLRASFAPYQTQSRFRAGIMPPALYMFQFTEPLQLDADSKHIRGHAVDTLYTNTHNNILELARYLPLLDAPLGVAGPYRRPLYFLRSRRRDGWIAALRTLSTTFPALRHISETHYKDECLSIIRFVHTEYLAMRLRPFPTPQAFPPPPEKEQE